MLMHLVTLRFRDDVRHEQVDGMAAALDALWPRVGGVVTYRHGRDLGLRDGNAGYGICAVLTGPDALPGYLDHPEHRRIAAELIAPITAVRQAVQLAVDA